MFTTEVKLKTLSVILLMLVITSINGKNCYQRNYKTVTREGQVLPPNETISSHRLEEPAVHVKCCLLCDKEPKCVGFNYRTTTMDVKNCQLTNTTRNRKTSKAGDWILWRDIVAEKSKEKKDKKEAVTPPKCSFADWSHSLSIEGWSKCEKDNLFITGLYRLHPGDSTIDPISLMEQARCCSSIPEFSNQAATCKKADWWISLDRDDTWSVCLEGYFLNGIYITKADNKIHNIELGHCCKPSNYPDSYGLCYDEDVGESFEREGWTNCSKLGYYITGFYRGYGHWLKNIDKFRCCQMAAE